ncbi:predicted protein [Phaeodactylum tricornutum CCAP 1055/1]|jgi:hypothetical protein|uniref:Acyltransferase n=2 Tax=Phaeodactylum tricornutum TaxID=2850 RepID=B7GAZ3_PHATC|nr:predicted protein [Phaeodactylum tricornutum CCAP 1055/1]AFM37314.1 diacylglycerol acyltransferase type 2 [Phaeodactylum tricornutum]EEC44340.1 predicted protein [Phaeodactylum tricornutum CCAP 1055/1]|eukprot:XP_002184162.1 predicted protein [Phaeodactylum tricornutum CCAP 1055/1]
MERTKIQDEHKSPPNPSTFRWFLGLLVASTFSMVYFVAPFYMLTVVFALVFKYPSVEIAWMYAIPMIVSAILPPMASPLALRLISPLIDYFDYEEIHETSPVDVQKEILSNNKNYLLVFQPHGALSFTGITSMVTAPQAMKGKLPTAVADALLYTPILKHVLGIFGLISASKSSMIRTLKKKGVEGTIVLYVGGIAELFLTDETDERLYLRKRKGFIKLALQQGVDVVPVYLFGNTNALSVLKTGFLAAISRKLQISLTYIWGKWYLPIPRDCKLLYASGQPLGMPHILDPSQADIDKWHEKYCSEVMRIFEKYKEKVPEYKHKKLEII